MKKIISPAIIAARIWLLTSLVFGAGWLFYMLLFEDADNLWTSIPATVGAAIGSLPVLLLLILILPRIEWNLISRQ